MSGSRIEAAFDLGEGLRATERRGRAARLDRNHFTYLSSLSYSRQPPGSGAAVANLSLSPARDDLSPPNKPAPKQLVAFSEGAVCLEIGPECPGISGPTPSVSQKVTSSPTHARLRRDFQQSATDKGDGPNNLVGFLKQHLATITPPRSLKILPDESGDVHLCMQAFGEDIQYASL